MPGHVRQLDARLVSEVPVLRDGEPVVVGDELEGVVGDGEKGFRRERGLREGDTASADSCMHVERRQVGQGEERKGEEERKGRERRGGRSENERLTFILCSGSGHHAAE